MRRVPAISLALALCLTLQTARAAEPAKAKPEAPNVKLSAVALPMIWHGRVLNYVFVVMRLDLMPGADPLKMKEKEPYFRDALVRMASRQSLNAPNTLDKIDETVLRAQMMALATKIVGPGLIKGVVIVSQIPQHYMAMPTPPPAAAPPIQS